VRKDNITPPKLAQKILQRLLRDDLAEEVTGDLEENFYLVVEARSVFRAKLNYWYQVLHYMRPFAIRKITSTRLNHYDMFQNYFRIGWRNLLRSKGHSLINIGGLAVGIAVAMMIGLWIKDELSYESYNDRSDRIARVGQHLTFNGIRRTTGSVPYPLAGEIQKSFGDDFKRVVMSWWMGDHILTHKENNFSRPGLFMSEGAPDLLALKMIRGSHGDLRDLNGILLSESAAKAIFGDRDPINEMMRIDNLMDVKVAGIYADMPYNSEFKDLNFVASWELFVSTQSWIRNARDDRQWDNSSFQLFVEISDRANMKQASEKIKNIKYDLSVEDRQNKPEIFLHPMKDWHLRASWENGVQSGGLIQYVWLFGIVGVFVVLLACINFMNLSTARSEKRAREVGIRKAVGSMRAQLVNQFLTESFLVVMIAFAMATLIVLIAIPSFNLLTSKQITFPFQDFAFWMSGAVFVLITGFLAGSYPAFFLSSFQPVKVLKGTFQSGRLGSFPRKVLVVVQFAVSVTLIISTVVVYRQIQHTKNRPMGYDQNRVMMIHMTTDDFNGKYDVLRNALKETGVVDEMSEASGPLTAVTSGSTGFSWEGKDPSVQADIGTVYVTHEFGRTVDWQIREGRDFSRDFGTDSTAMIINESAAKFLGLKNPVGSVVRSYDDRDLRIVGVVSDMLMESPFKPVQETFYIIDHNYLDWILVKLNDEHPLQESVSRVEAVFKKNLPMVPFEFKFADQEHELKFASEVQVGKLAGIFATLAVLISCLGLFGLASFIAEQRTKEIGIRKVMGATVTNVWAMLSKDFVILVLIACALAIPVAYYLSFNWIQQYQYRAEITWWIFGVSVAGALVITLLTVSYQAVKAGLMNPVKSLRSE
jgi:putative ABC transport system permease protein